VKSWYNYRLRKYVTDGPTDDTVLDYMPQNPAAEMLYRIYHEEGGLSLLDALANVLTAVLGQPVLYPPAWSVAQQEDQ